MAWYSYFLLCTPEAFAMIVFTLVLLGISIKENLKPIVIFSFIDGAVAFVLNILMTNSLKPILAITAYSLLVAFIFKCKITHGFIVGLISFMVLILSELTFSLIYANVFALDFQSLLANPLYRILMGTCTNTLPLLITAFVLQKYKIQLKVPLLSK